MELKASLENILKASLPYLEGRAEGRFRITIWNWSRLSFIDCQWPISFFTSRTLSTCFQNGSRFSQVAHVRLFML